MFISRRVLIISGVVAVIFAGVMGFGFAFAFSHANQASQDTTPSDTSTAVASVTTSQRACVLGVVQSLSSQSFVVSANQGKRIVTVTVNDQTMYTKHGSQASFTFVNLVVGDKVRVTVQGQCNRRDTSVLAQSVTVLTSTGNPGALPISSPTP